MILYQPHFYKLPLRTRRFRLLALSSWDTSDTFTVSPMPRGKENSALIVIELRTYIGKHISLAITLNQSCLDTMSAVKIFNGPDAVDEMNICEEFHGADAKINVIGVFLMKLTYFASAVNSSILNITYKSKDMDYGAVGINTAYPVYKFTVTFNDSSLHYQQCKFTSEMYGPLTFSRIRHFQGFTEQCNFGGFLLSEASNRTSNRRSMFAPYCTRLGAEPLLNNIKHWYLADGGTFLTMYSFGKYFTIDVDVSIQLTKCPGK